jgi:hypothetical protein
MRWLTRSAGRYLLAGLLAGASFQASPLFAQGKDNPVLLEPDQMIPHGVPTAAQAAPPGTPPQQPEALPAPGTPGTPVETAPPADAPAPAAAGCADGKDGKDGKDDCAPIPFWQRVPVVQRFPFPGWLILQPTGPGYYSLADCLHGEYRKGPPKYPYPRVSIIPFSFFEVDWRYLDDPKNEEHDYFDFLKRIHIGDNWMFTTGGEFRYRYNNEHNSRLSGRDNDYSAERTRVYGDLWYQDKFRIYVEGLDARTQNQSLPPLVIDNDYFPELLNGFVDLKLWQFADGPAYFRVGRQELLYGSQRLISPLDFANTRRTFQGLKTFYRSDCLDLDAFCVQPVIPNPRHFDSVDDRQVFSGIWATYRPKPTQAIDAYVLNLDNSNRTTQLGIIRAPINVTTFGGRYVGNYDGRWMWETETMFQVGTVEGVNTTVGDRGLLTHADALGFGYCFKDVPSKPQFWLYYEYASGDKTPNVGVDKTFQQLFPFGHFYFGGTDQIGRQNINDFNGQFIFWPVPWIGCLAQYHILRLDSATDALYNAAGNAIRRDPTGRAGTDVGEVLNLVVNFHLDKHQDIFIQNAHLFSGTFIKKTGSPGDLNALYVQYSYRW